MPVPSTCDELLELIRKSELIPAARLDAFLDQFDAALPRDNPRQLAKTLVAAGLITQFQSEQFLQGKWRGFTLGKYKVLERLGSGGMGTVYLCEHVLVGRKVAIKVLPNSQADNPAALQRFYREARASGILDHPNLVRAHDIDAEGGLHFLVMDYVDGSSLQDIVTRFGPLSIQRAVNYICQAAKGLQHAYEVGLVHRDIKPANILLERNGTIRVLDLGLARFYHDNTDQLTLKYDDKNVLGTADYVSPEQALNSHEVDIRTDIYSLGATFYFLLTGQTLFGPGKIAQKLIWHQVRQPTSVQELRPDVPAELAAVLTRMIAKNPEQRYQTPLEVVEALAPWFDESLPPPPQAEMPQLSPASAAATTVNPPVPSANRDSRSNAPVIRAVSATPLPRPKSSGRVAILSRLPSVNEQATPQNLNSQTPTGTAHKRPTPPRLLQQVEPAPPPMVTTSSSGVPIASLLRVALLILTSTVIGVALTWWLTRR